MDYNTTGPRLPKKLSMTIFTEKSCTPNKASMSFAPIPPVKQCVFGLRQPSGTSNEFIYVDPQLGAVPLGNAPPTDDTPMCSSDQRTDCAFMCTGGKYVGFTGDFNSGTRYTYMDVADSINNDIRFFDFRTRNPPYTGEPDGTLGATGSGRDRSHTLNLGPLPLFFSDKHYSRRYLPGLGSAKNAVLGTNLNTGGSYPLVPPYGQPWT